MAWSELELNKPIASANGTDVVTETRENFSSLFMLCVVNGLAFPGYAYSTNPSGVIRPTEYRYRRGAAATVGSVWMRAAVVWGTAGGELNRPIQYDFFFSDDGGSTEQKMTMHGNNRATLAYSSDGFLTTVTWSLSP